MEIADNTELYRDLRTRLTKDLREAGGDGSGPVPCCPEWTVAQTTAHLSGVCADVLAGNIGGAGTDAWTAAQVEPRAAWDLAQVLAEWDELGPTVEGLLAGGLAPDQWIFDAITHEQDLRGAIGRPGHRDGDGVVVAVRFVIDALAAGLPDGVPPLRIVSGPFDQTFGGDEPVATLTVEPFELLRAASGRRSLDQIRALDWGGADPEPFLPLFTFGPFQPHPVGITE